MLNTAGANGCRAILALAVFFAGCGGVTDPFERTDVSGAVNLDDMPLQYGELYFKGQPNENSEVAQCYVQVRDGTFSTERSAKPGPGENQVTLIVYTEDPDKAEEEGKDAAVKGIWQTTTNVQPGEALTFDVKSSELKKSSD